MPSFALPRTHTLAYMQHVPREVYGLDHLVEVDLHGNCLTALPEEVGAFAVLKSLDLSRNAIQIIPPPLTRFDARR